MKRTHTPDFKRLQLQQLDDRLSVWKKLMNNSPPQSGRISSIRRALGMGLAQLGRRIGTTPIGMKRLEQREAAGTITLESLARAAEAMGCHLVYALVPKTSLHAVVNGQAHKTAREMLGRVDQTMRLEEQEVTASELASQEAALAHRLLMEWPRSLWEESGQEQEDG